MSKDPAFLFYPNDWIGGTMGMSFEEKGAYIELLMMQFNRGHMTEHMIGLTIGHLFGQIKDKFTQDKDGLWYNERLDEEKEKRKKFVESRHNNKKGQNQYTKNNEKSNGHMSNHMENENEIVNEGINKEESDFENSAKQFLSDHIFKEQFSMANKLMLADTENRMIEFVRKLRTKENYQTQWTTKSSIIAYFKNSFNKMLREGKVNNNNAYYTNGVIDLEKNIDYSKVTWDGN